MSKVKLNVSALREEMSAVRLSDCEPVQKYASNIQSYVNDFNLCANSNHSSTGSGTMPKREHTDHLMNGVQKDEDWRLFAQLMYGMMDTLADKSGEIIGNINAHKARLPNEDDLKLAAILSKLRRKSVMRI